MVMVSSQRLRFPLSQPISPPRFYVCMYVCMYACRNLCSLSLARLVGQVLDRHVVAVGEPELLARALHLALRRHC